MVRTDRRSSASRASRSTRPATAIPDSGTDNVATAATSCAVKRCGSGLASRAAVSNRESRVPAAVVLGQQPDRLVVIDECVDPALDRSHRRTIPMVPTSKSFAPGSATYRRLRALICAGTSGRSASASRQIWILVTGLKCSDGGASTPAMLVRMNGSADGSAVVSTALGDLCFDLVDPRGRPSRAPHGIEVFPIVPAAAAAGHERAEPGGGAVDGDARGDDDAASDFGAVG